MSRTSPKLGLFALFSILVVLISPVTLWAQDGGPDASLGLPTFDIDMASLGGWLVGLWQAVTGPPADGNGGTAPQAMTGGEGSDDDEEDSGLPGIGPALVPIG